MNELAAAVVHPDEYSFTKYRPCNGVTFDAEVRFDVAHELEWIFARAIALVYEREDRNSSFLADIEQLARSLFHTAAVVEQHHRGISGDECSICVFRKIFVTGRVEKIHMVSVVLE